MRSRELDALMDAVKGILDAELQQRRDLLKLAEISDDSVLANAVRSRREGFEAETDEIRRCVELLASGCSSDYGELVDEVTPIDDEAPIVDEREIHDADERDDSEWDVFVRR